MVHIYFHTFFLSQALTLTNARLFGGDSEKRNLIIGGGEAEKGRYPYMVSFQHENSHFCGGSLIAPDVVLTAAHCESPDSFAVIGRHHWMKEKEGEAIEISEQLPHPDFNFTGDDYDGDIMLLFLERPVADDVPIVKLNSDSSVPEVDSPVTVLGWGDTDIDWLNFEMSDVLKSAEVYVESNEECKESEGLIQGDPAWYMDHVTENMLCAEAEGTDSCQTDSGEIV
jgi:trypsin